MKRCKGISMISLTVAVCILLILSSMLIYNAESGIKIKKLEMMKRDIELLDGKINSYYAKYDDIPVGIEYTNTSLLDKIKLSGQIEQEDNDIYYVIDLNKLDGITLNYGKEFSNINSEADIANNDDIYIINEQSHSIYYVRGIEMDNAWYYTDTSK